MNEKEYIIAVDEWIEKIKNWDCEDVYYLRDILRDYPKIPDAQNYYELQIYVENEWEKISDNLPIAEEFEDIVSKYSSYPIWTCDKNGFCLVGDVADSIVHIEYIKDN